MTVLEAINVIDVVAPEQRAPAKGRILDTVDVLFYEDGIRNVGVDRIISESSVTKATFYKHYGAKDNLIVEYISHRHTHVRAEMEALIAAAATPKIALRRFIAGIIAEVDSAGFRGCAFINAAAEFPQHDHPVRKVVTMHREWLTDTLADLLRQMGHPVPGDGADELLLARDGAFTGGYAGDAIASSAALSRIADRVFAESSAA